VSGKSLPKRAWTRLSSEATGWGSATLPRVRQKDNNSPRSLTTQVQLEAVEPAQRGLAASGIHGEDAVLLDARGVADGNRGRVDEAEAGAPAHVRVQKLGDQREQDSGHELDEARGADQLGDLGDLGV